MEAVLLAWVGGREGCARPSARPAAARWRREEGEGGRCAAPPAGLRAAGLPGLWHERREDGLSSLLGRVNRRALTAGARWFAACEAGGEQRAVLRATAPVPCLVLRARGVRTCRTF